MHDSYTKVITSFCHTLRHHLESELEIHEHTLDLMEIKSEQLPFTIYLYGENSPKRIINHTNKSIHIDVDILYNKYEIVIRRILSIALNQQKAYARQTVVARIDKKHTLLFLAENHLQGEMPGKYRYGLFLKGELISIAVFSGGRKMPDLNKENYRSFELIRFCHKLGYNVVGGVSKLLKAFIKDFDPGDIMTYTDKDWNQESSLEKIGFYKKSELEGLRFWIFNNHRLLVRDEEQFKKLKEDHPNGYMKENLGSLKMILSLK